MIIKIIQNWTYQKIIWTKYFIIDKPYLVEVKIYWINYTIFIHKWFITDLGSIPPIFFFFDKSRYIFYIVHDYLYSLVWKIVNIYWKLKYNQNFADNILFEWLKVEWMNATWRNLVLKWLDIWWKYHFKKEDKNISKLKKELWI